MRYRTYWQRRCAVRVPPDRPVERRIGDGGVNDGGDIIRAEGFAECRKRIIVVCLQGDFDVLDKNERSRTKGGAGKAAQGAGSTERRKRSRLLDAEVGQSIRFHRKNAKMTLQGLADRLGIAYQQVQKYETGVNRVGAGRLMEIAEILDIPVASFFEGVRAREQPAADAPDPETVMQGRLVQASFLRIKDPHKRRTALNYIRSLGESEES